MRRLLATLAIALAAAGCKGSSATNPLDPFSRTRIEPPRTGWISNQPAADPYYPGTRQATLPESHWKSSGSGAGSAVSPPSTPKGYSPQGGAHQRAEGSGREPPALADGRTPPMEIGRPFATPNRSAPIEIARPFATPKRDDPIEIARPFSSPGHGDRISVPLAARSTADLSTMLASNRSSTPLRPGATTLAHNTPSDTVAATSSAVATTASAAFAANRSSGPLPGSAARSEHVEPERIVRTLEPRPGIPHTGSAHAGSGPGALSTTPRNSSRAALPPGTVDIMDLPPVGSRSGTGVPAPKDEVRFASADIPLEGSSSPGSTARDADGAAPVSPQGRYGYDPDYRWLKGKLDFSEIDRRWKLRYIPIDGTTDEFGGSVVLSAGSLQEGYERGDFVEVHGVLGAPAPGDDTGYAPEFEVRQIAPLGK